MDPDQMRRRCPGAQARGPALLPNHTLIFTWDSAFWRGGVGSILPRAGAHVRGVLWDIGPEHERSLDRYELVRKDVYRKETVSVTCVGAAVAALVYIATATEWKEPSDRYLRALVRGARAFGLPPEYVAGLEAVQTR